MSTTLPDGPRWFVAGDLDGFLGLALDNLIQIRTSETESWSLG